MPAIPTLDVERALLSAGGTLVALDEVGRGALAGPVSVGAVLIDGAVGAPPAGLKDSKLLTALARERLMAPIQAWAAAYAVGHAWPEEIDRWGIMGALRLAAYRAMAALRVPVHAVLLDGNVDYLSPRGVDDTLSATTTGADDVILRWTAPTVTTRVKADRDCAAVAAASVLAKVTRDALMTELDADFPRYGWAANRGYGTAAHAASIAEYGTCRWHRLSWHLPGADGDAAVARMGDDGERER